jgi:hypothetical protein
MSTTSTRKPVQRKRTRRTNSKATGARTGSSQLATAIGLPGLVGLLVDGIPHFLGAIMNYITKSCTHDSGKPGQESGAMEAISRSASDVTEWAKKHPIQTAIGVAVLVAGVAVAVELLKNKRSDEQDDEDEQGEQEDDEPSAESTPKRSRKSSARRAKAAETAALDESEGTDVVDESTPTGDRSTETALQPDPAQAEEEERLHQAAT